MHSKTKVTTLEELDALAAEKCMGWYYDDTFMCDPITRICYDNGGTDHGVVYMHPNNYSPTRDANQSDELLEHVANDWTLDYRNTDDPNDRYRCVICNDGEYKAIVWNADMNVAKVLACLEACGVSVELELKEGE